MRECNYYVVYIRFWDNRVIKRLVWGTKKDLYAYVGYMYSNSLEKIDRIDYTNTDIYEHIKDFDRYHYITDTGVISASIL